MKITRVTNGSGLKNIVRAAKSRVSGSSSAFVKRNRRDIVPEAIAAIDDHHLGQEPALAVADHNHLVKRRVLSLGIDAFAHRLRAIPANASRTTRSDCRCYR